MQAILADNYFWLPKQASTVAGSSDNLFNFVLWVCVFFFLLITVLLVFFVIKYRHKPGEARDVSASHSMTLELTWTIIPSILCVFLYYYGFKEYMNLAIEPPNAYQVIATGRMWQWSFTYPNGIETEELHCVVNQAVRCTLESNDVIHSLYIPAFRVKKDVVPGRYNRLWFQATIADGEVYVTTGTISGQPIEIAVDAEGKPLSGNTAHTPSQRTVNLKDKEIPTAVQGVFASAAAGTTQPAGRPIRTFTLLNGASVYMGSVDNGGQPTEMVVDAQGTAAMHESIQFGAAPAAVQSGLQSQSPDATIQPSQAVYVFQDAEAYDIFCAGYCGTNHSTMRSRVVVHRTQADFDAWLKLQGDNPNIPAPIRGRKLYVSKGCAQCHSIDGTRITGPSWKDLFGSTQHFTDGSQAVVDEAFVHTFLPNPTARVPMGYTPIMPPMPLKPSEIDLVIAFMKTISSNYHGSLSPQPGTGVASTQPTTVPTTVPATEPAK